MILWVARLVCGGRGQVRGRARAVSARHRVGLLGLDRVGSPAMVSSPLQAPLVEMTPKVPDGDRGEMSPRTAAVMKMRSRGKVRSLRQTVELIDPVRVGLPRGSGSCSFIVEASWHHFGREIWPRGNQWCWIHTLTVI